MAKPKVPKLSEAMAMYAPAYAGQKNLINKQIAAIPGQTQAALGGLDVAKTNEFRDIRRGANASGMAFSGIPIEEQTRYLGEHYLPGRANLEATGMNQRLTLQQALAGLDTDVRNRAIDYRTDRQKALEAYVEAERERALKVQMQREQIAADSRRQSKEDAPPTVNEFLVDAFGNADISKAKSSMWTEDVLAGQVAAAYGISRDKALFDYIYPFRKNYYGW